MVAAFGPEMAAGARVQVPGGLQSPVMVSPASRVSLDAYFALDSASEAKVEYYDGSTVAMAGASPRHNRVAGNVLVALRGALEPRGCYVAQSDQRTRLAATHAYVYPDVVASCSPRFDDARPRSLVNPELVVEVLSRSTESHDLSAKLAHYRATDTIQDIVFVRLGERLIEHHHRIDPSRWLVVLVRDGRFDVAGASLDTDVVYAGIEALPPEDD